MKKFNNTLYVALLILGLIGVAGVLPYIFSIMRTPIPSSSIPMLVVLQLIQAALLLALTLYLGMVASSRIGWSAPYLEALVARKKIPSSMATSLSFAAMCGILLALLLFLLDVFLLGTSIPSIVANAGTVPAWQRVLAALYGGIDEELLMRFFLLSVLVSLSLMISKHVTKKGGKTTAVWVAIILSSLFFAFGQLPASTFSASGAVPSIVRVALLQGLAGILFGWLYWKKGLEAAMVAHFSSDVMLLVILPLVA
jgi:membrane protease YdiL (CAAX protease family)